MTTATPKTVTIDTVDSFIERLQTARATNPILIHCGAFKADYKPMLLSNGDTLKLRKWWSDKNSQWYYRVYMNNWTVCSVPVSLVRKRGLADAVLQASKKWAKTRFTRYAANSLANHKLAMTH